MTMKPSDFPVSVLFVSSVWSTLHAFVRPLASELATHGCRTIAAAGGRAVQSGSFHVYASLPEFRRRSPLHLVRAAAALVQVVRQNKVQLMYAQTPLAVILGRMVGAVTGVPVVAQIYGTFLGCGGNSERAFRTTERATSRFARSTITLNQSDADFYRGFLDPSSVWMFPGVGVPEDRLRDAARSDPSSDRMRPVIGAVGRLTPDKGLDVVMNAVRRLRAGGIDAQLRLIGAAMPRETEWRPPDEPWIHLTGWLEDPYDAMADCDVLVAGSRREGFGQATAEALVMGVPVVAVANAGSREQKRLAGERLTLVEPGDDAAFAAALAYVLSDARRTGFQSDLAEAWGERAYLQFHRDHLAWLFPGALRS
jgi:glycosyltransferase involved in cell wall biosynthesis